MSHNPDNPSRPVPQALALCVALSLGMAAGTGIAQEQGSPDAAGGAGKPVENIVDAAGGTVTPAENIPDARRGGEAELGLLVQFPADVLNGGLPDDQGLVGSNKGHWYNVGSQRGVMWTLIGAAAAGDAVTAERCFTAIDAAFARQEPDGGFFSNKKPDAARGPGLNDRVTDAFFWLQAFTHAALVVESSTLAPLFQDRLLELKPKVRRSLDFVASHLDLVHRHHDHAANRIYFAAAAFCLGGVWLDDAKFMQVGRDLLDGGLNAQMPDGVFPENGGGDSSYQAVSLMQLQIIATYLDSPSLDAAIERGMQWQLGKIGPDGTVDVTGNTRTGVGKETYMGRAKGVNYREVAIALSYYGARMNSRQHLDLAAAVLNNRPK